MENDSIAELRDIAYCKTMNDIVVAYSQMQIL